MLNLLVKPAWILLETIVQNEVGHIEYGTFAALYSLSFIFLSVTDLGINMFTTRKLAHQPESWSEIFSSAISVKITIGLLYPLVIIGVGALLGYNNYHLYLLGIISFTQALFQLLLFFRSNFQARQLFTLDSLVSVFDKIILFLLILILLYLGINLERFIYSRLIAALLTLLVSYIVLLKIFGFVKPRLNLASARTLIAQSIPFGIMALLFSINEKLDQVMLERLGGTAQGALFSGLYAASYRWMEAFQMYLWTIFPFFLARFSFALKDKKLVQKVFDLGQVVTAFPLIFICVFVFYYAEYFFWLFEDSTSEQIKIMADTTRILFLSVLVNGFFAFYSVFLTSVGLEKKIILVISVSILINFTLNWFFIPVAGIYAAAWSTFISVIFLNLSYIIFVVKYSIVKLPEVLILKLIVATILIYLVFGVLEYFYFDWISATLIAGIVSLFVFYMLGFVSVIKSK